MSQRSSGYPLPAPDDGAPPDEGRALPVALAEHLTRPRHLGRMHQPDGLGSATRECGDTLEFSLLVRQGQIVRVAYLAESCALTVACASMAATLAEGRAAREVRQEVDAAAIIRGLGGLPPGEEHCAELAARALQAAINDYFRCEREPWKRLYRG